MKQETRDARLSLLKEFHKTACIRGRTKWGKGKVQNFRSVLRLASMLIGFIFFLTGHNTSVAMHKHDLSKIPHAMYME